MATEKELRQKVIEVAQSWLGCNENDGTHKKVIDAYNSQKPIPNGFKMQYDLPWCATFVTACFFKAGLVDLITPECSCPRMVTGCQKMGIWVENDAYIPQIGTIIMYDWDDNGSGDNKGTPDHVGIVEKVEGNTITVIEGNISDAVGRRTIQVNGKYIRGYIEPNFASKASTKANSKDTNNSAIVNNIPVSASPEEIIWSLLYTEIKNAYGVAGLMGNLYAESGLFPNNLQNTYNTKFNMTDAQYTSGVDNGTYKNFVNDSAGYGLAQWTYYSRKQGLLNYAKANKTSIADVRTQIGFLIKELNTSYKKVLNTLKTAKSVKEASDIVLTQFECPLVQTESVKEARVKYGTIYYNKYKNGLQISNTTSTSSITNTINNSTNSIRVGDKVKVINSITYAGVKFTSYYKVYDVLEVKNDRAVIGVGKVITASINTSNLQKV